jgi:PAS domain S-box-containing protein
LALGPLPAWLWSADASRVLWANPTGAAIFGASSAAALAVRAFDYGQPAAAQVAELATALPADGGTRLVRLRAFGAGIGRTLPCSCSRVTLADGAPAVLIVAMERGGPDLPLKERVSRLLADSAEPIAAFAADGALIDATPAARLRLGANTSLASLGAEALAMAARQNGHTVGAGLGGPLVIDRIGEDAEAVLVVALDAAANERAAATASFAEPAISACVEGPLAMAAVPQPDTPPVPSPAAGQRRPPLRFVWQMDADNRFTIDSQEFIDAIGPRSAALLGQPWDTIVSAIGLDPGGQVAQALATHDTWSGVTIEWPIDGGDRRLPVEMSGLPVFDRDRAFRGYRGFGVCRDFGHRDGESKTDVTATRPSEPARVVTLHLPDEAEAPSLSPGERHAFQELSRRLAVHINAAMAKDDSATTPFVTSAGPHAGAAAERADAAPLDAAEPIVMEDARPFLDRLPVGVLVYRLSHLLYANGAFLDWAGYEDLDALAEAGGLDNLLIEPGAIAIEEGGRKSFVLTSPRDPAVTAEARLLTVPWDGESAFALIATPPGADAHAPAAPVQERTRTAELEAILDTATDGVVVIDRAARIVSANRSAQALFGYDALELDGKLFSDLFATDSIVTATDYLERLQGGGAGSVLNDGREIIGRERNGGPIPLFMTMGRLGEGGEKLCAVFRDVTQWKKTERELIAARRDAERASAAKSDFLARISHEIRTPLNSIIGFSDVMMNERFGPVGNERYRQYLEDIHASGGHLLSLVNDLLDLSKIEAGKLELTFANISLNDVTQQCVAIMQPQANRERIIIRMSLSPKLPQVVADARSVRQIVLNLLSNSIKFTGAGGQVIVATALTDRGGIVLRVRDTGVGMSEQDIAIALEPFGQVATSTQQGSGGTGLGLPLTKALAEANRANFHIRSAPNAGTLVEITFPSAQVLTQPS